MTATARTTDRVAFTDQLIRDWPGEDFMGHERAENLIRFAARVRDAGFGVEDVILAAEHGNDELNAPPLPLEDVHRIAAMVCGETPAEQLIAKLPKPVIQPEKVIYLSDHLPAREPAGEAPKIALESPAEIDPAAILKTDYLVKGWLDRGTLAQVFGQWGSGKTFALLHLSAHVAAGAPWFGNRVRQGGVLYVGYEGARSMAKRIEALKRELPGLNWREMPFRWVSFRWPLVRKGGLSGAPGREKLDQALIEFQAATGRAPALIIIDPLRDALGGSDSDVELTGPYVTLIRQICHTTGATVLTVHHPGHGDKARGRGDSGIPGAMDTDIRITAENGRGEISATKQRDTIKGRLYYRLKPVELGHDSDGDAVTSCVIEQTRAPIECTLTGNQLKAWNAIIGDAPAGSMSEDEARRRCRDAGIAAGNVTRTLLALANKKLIEWDRKAERVTIAEIFPDDEDAG